MDAASINVYHAIHWLRHYMYHQSIHRTRNKRLLSWRFLCWLPTPIPGVGTEHITWKENQRHQIGCSARIDTLCPQSSLYHGMPPCHRGHVGNLPYWWTAQRYARCHSKSYTSYLAWWIDERGSISVNLLTYLGVQLVDDNFQPFSGDICWKIDGGCERLSIIFAHKLYDDVW